MEGAIAKPRHWQAWSSDRRRIMFGTDQMGWPDAIGMAIEVIESVEFLTEDQRRDIFYNNAARFLHLAASDGPRLPGLPLDPWAPSN